MRIPSIFLAAFSAALLASAPTEAGFAPYVSNMDETPSGYEPIAIDSWLAQVFHTGSNTEGYTLDAIQLRTAAPSGSPTGFEAFLYSSIGLEPGDSLGSLSGPDPAAGGGFTFSGSPVFLEPSSFYFVVVTAGTPASEGAYAWNMTSAPGNVQGWDIPNIRRYRSLDGSEWTLEGRRDVFQMAIYATAVPEPTTCAMLGLGLIGIWLFRRRSHDSFG